MTSIHWGQPQTKEEWRKIHRQQELENQSRDFLHRAEDLLKSHYKDPEANPLSPEKRELLIKIVCNGWLCSRSSHPYKHPRIDPPEWAIPELWNVTNNFDLEDELIDALEEAQEGGPEEYEAVKELWRSIRERQLHHDNVVDELVEQLQDLNWKERERG